MLHHFILKYHERSFFAFAFPIFQANDTWGLAKHVSDCAEVVLVMVLVPCALTL
jgi:hypothetical protein